MLFRSPVNAFPPTEKVTVPGKEIGLNDYAQTLMKYDPEGGATLKALIQESDLGAKERDVSSKEAIANMRMDVAKYLGDQRLSGVLAGVAQRANRPEFTKGDLLKYKADLRKGYSEDMKPLLDLNIGGIRKGSESEAADLRNKLEADLQEADDAFRGTDTLKRKRAVKSNMPDPAKYKGKTGTDTATGKRYKSDGTKWVEIK